MKILIVDDEQTALTSVRRILRRAGLKNVEICDNGKEAIDRIRDTDYDIVLLDILMPNTDGLQVLESAKPYSPTTEFIIISALEDIPTTIKALRLGAYDYLVKPLDTQRLLLSIYQAFERKGLKAGALGDYSEDSEKEIPEAFSPIITRSGRLKELIEYVKIMVRCGNPILITGESGTGKELFAKAIHRIGPGPNTPFVAVNVSAVPETLFESQFFGHVKGAFTGAETDQNGYFEKADRGTLFLDEIGEIPLNLQAKLLRVLEEKTVIRIGEKTPRFIQAQIVSSTNKDLNHACREGKFRLDLLYRLNSVHIHLPPLRDRPEDIPVLAAHFLSKARFDHGIDVRGFNSEALDMLGRCDYPGNVREFAHVVERAALVAGSGWVLPQHLDGTPATEKPFFSENLCSLKEIAEAHIAYVLSQCGEDRKAAAEILRISVRQLQRRLAQMKR